jgi:hypothetical protein
MGSAIAAHDLGAAHAVALVADFSRCLWNSTGALKLGQPQPESNFAADSNKASPQPMQR